MNEKKMQVCVKQYFALKKKQNKTKHNIWRDCYKEVVTNTEVSQP